MLLLCTFISFQCILTQFSGIRIGQRSLCIALERNWANGYYMVLHWSKAAAWSSCIRVWTLERGTKGWFINNSVEIFRSSCFFVNRLFGCHFHLQVLTFSSSLNGLGRPDYAVKFIKFRLHRRWCFIQIQYCQSVQQNFGQNTNGNVP